jgi:GNAT superfamily N-acetyltransferase
MESLVIRPLVATDIAAARATAAALQPPHLATEGLTLLQDVYRVSADRFCLAAEREREGGVLGCGALWRVRDGKFRLDLMVHPRSQQQGIGGALLARLLAEAEQQGAETVQARARDDCPAALAFLQHRGFAETHRMQRFDLDLTRVERPGLQRFRERATAQGVAFTTLAAEQARDPDCLRRLYALHLAALVDWPDPDPAPGRSEPPSYADFLRVMETTAVVPARLLLAKVEDRLVGYCGDLGTAVHSAHRGQGIATALEAWSIQRALDEDRDSLVGASANPAMHAVYAKLGYRRGFAEVRLVRRLGTE